KSHLRRGRVHLRRRNDLGGFGVRGERRERQGGGEKERGAEIHGGHPKTVVCDMSVCCISNATRHHTKLHVCVTRSRLCTHPCDPAVRHHLAEMLLQREERRREIGAAAA